MSATIDPARAKAIRKRIATMNANVEKHGNMPPWWGALFLLSGLHARMVELMCSSPQMEESVAALMERLLDGGEPV